MKMMTMIVRTVRKMAMRMPMRRQVKWMMITREIMIMQQSNRQTEILSLWLEP